MSYTKSLTCPYCGAEKDTHDYHADSLGCTWFSDWANLTERHIKCVEDFKVKISIHASSHVVEGESDEE